MKGKFESLIADHERFHSSFQIDHFVLGRGGETPYGQYCQALRELESRYEAMKLEALEVECLRVEIGLLEDQGRDLGGEEPFRHIDLAKAQLRLDSLRRIEADRSRELSHIVDCARRLKASIPDLTPENRQILERDSWLHRIKHKAAMDVLSMGTMSTGTLEAISAFPPGVKCELLAFAQPQNFQALQDFVMIDHGEAVASIEGDKCP